MSLKMHYDNINPLVNFFNIILTGTLSQREEQSSYFNKLNERIETTDELIVNLFAQKNNNLTIPINATKHQQKIMQQLEISHTRRKSYFCSKRDILPAETIDMQCQNETDWKENYNSDTQQYSENDLKSKIINARIAQVVKEKNQSRSLKKVESTGHMNFPTIEPNDNNFEIINQSSTRNKFYSGNKKYDSRDSLKKENNLKSSDTSRSNNIHLIKNDSSFLQNNTPREKKHDDTTRPIKINYDDEDPHIFTDLNEDKFIKKHKKEENLIITNKSNSNENNTGSNRNSMTKKIDKSLSEKKIKVKDDKHVIKRDLQSANVNKKKTQDTINVERNIYENAPPFNDMSPTRNNNFIIDKKIDQDRNESLGSISSKSSDFKCQKKSNLDLTMKNMGDGNPTYNKQEIDIIKSQNTNHEKSSLISSNRIHQLSNAEYELESLK